MAEKNPQSLQRFSEEEVISNLGKLAQSVECWFSCGGTISQLKSTDLLYKKQSGDWCSKPLQLPAGLSGVSMEEFLDSCSTASFGFGGETVTDKKYRDALKLEPDCFRSDFEVANTCILDRIARIMVIGSAIRAELYKLNVYSVGGHFRSHVDTPHSQQMFGSLVVCLPSEFTGGALVTRHQGRQVTFDWSSSVATHWAAFFSDVEHEVLPVTSGYRITLTYNLYYLIEDSPLGVLSWNEMVNPALFSVIGNPLYQEFLAALKNPHFMRRGGTLGFYCRYKYTNTSTDLDQFHPFLKGEDAIVYKIAKSLGLSIVLKPLLSKDIEYWQQEACINKIQPIPGIT